MLSIPLLQSVGLLVGLILLGVLLRWRGILGDEHGPVLARLVTQVTLPALIVSALSRSTIEAVYVELALVMLVAELICLALGWGLARRLRLGPAQTGAVILTAGFGSSSMLGYALIGSVFSSDPAALTEAAMISELGVGPALFILGTLIALYYGAKASDTERADGAATTAALAFFRSPIFLALCIGSLWSVADLPQQGALLGPLFHAIDLVAAANTLLVALCVGLALRFDGLRAILAVALGVMVIKLIAKPILVWLPGQALADSASQLEVLVIEAAMPSALLAVVLSRRFGCDAALASKLVLATSLGCVLTVVLMVNLLTAGP
jgi:predicted permease